MPTESEKQPQQPTNSDRLTALEKQNKDLKFATLAVLETLLDACVMGNPRRSFENRLREAITELTEDKE